MEQFYAEFGAMKPAVQLQAEVSKTFVPTQFLLPTFLPIYLVVRLPVKRSILYRTGTPQVQVSAECNEVCERYDAAGRLLNDLIKKARFETIKAIQS